MVADNPPPLRHYKPDRDQFGHGGPPKPQPLRMTTAFGRCAITALTNGFHSSRDSRRTGCQAAPEHLDWVCISENTAPLSKYKTDQLIGTANMNVSKMADFVRWQENNHVFPQPFHPQPTSSRLRMAVSGLKTAAHKTPEPTGKNFQNLATPRSPKCPQRCG